MKTSARTTRLVGGSALPRILVLELRDQRQYSTKGTDSYVYYVVTDEDFANLGPYIEDIQVIAELKDSTADFRFKVKGQKSYRGESWSDFSGDVLGEQTAAASPIAGNVYTTRTDLACPRIQLLIGIKNADSVTTFQNGVISLQLIIKFFK